jgi:phosphoglycolate phosphatase-like HAD superfamily hydrolase
LDAAARLNAVAIRLDALAETDGLWRAWLEDARRRYRLDEGDLDTGELDAQLPNWRALLERFAEERAPVYFRPDASVTDALRRLQRNGVRIGVFAGGPLELARVALSHLGASRRVELLEAGPGALGRIRDALGGDATVVGTRTELLAL